MKSKLTITIKKRAFTEVLTWFLIIMPFTFGFLNDLMGFSRTVKYVLDVVWIVLAFLMMQNIHISKIKKLSAGIAYILMFSFFTLAVYAVQYQSVFYYLWGYRNSFRLYAAFFSFCVFLSQEDTISIWKLFDRIFWVSVIVSLIQYFVYGYNQDNLGGIFGTESGCNAYNNIFFLIILSKSILLYLEKQETAISCVAKCASAMLVSALAEMKFFFVEFIVLVGLAVLFTNFTWRKLWVVIGSVVGVLVGTTLLTQLFPLFEGWFTLDHILSVATSEKGYTSSGDMNRLTAIPMINELWLKNWGERLFGLGLGNCDTSTFAIVNTPFYEAYGDMHYTWLSYAMIYLECGWIGLIFYFGFFVLVYLGARRIERRSEGIGKTYCRMGRIMAIMCMIISIYNSSLRTEAGYMAYFVLALPFVFGRESERGREKNGKAAATQHSIA